MSKNKNPTPNDQRSNTKNPERPEHKSAQDNRSNQMNPNHPNNPNNPPSHMPSHGGGMTGGDGSPKR